MTDLRTVFAGIPVLRGVVEAALTKAPTHVETPCCALHHGDFTILAGPPDAAYLRAHAAELRAEIYAPNGWPSVLTEAGVAFHMENRIAFDHAVQPLDGHLRTMLKSVPEGAAFVPIEGELIGWCRQQAWTKDFVSQFSDAAFAAQGLGVLLRVGGDYVSGASS